MLDNSEQLLFSIHEVYHIETDVVFAVFGASGSSCSAVPIS